MRDEDYEGADYLIGYKDSKDNNVSEIFWIWEKKPNLIKLSD